MFVVYSKKENCDHRKKGFTSKMYVIRLVARFFKNLNVSSIHPMDDHSDDIYIFICVCLYFIQYISRKQCT